MSRTIVVACLALAIDSGREAIDDETDPPAPAPVTITDDRFEATLRAVDVRPDFAGIAQLLRRALPSDQHAAEVANLIADLGSDEFEDRQKATTALLALPHPPIKALQVAADSEDLEVRERSRRILSEVERGVHLRSVYAALRTIERRRVQGLSNLLLPLIPYWTEEVMLTAARRALVVTAQPHDAPLLRRAIHGPDPQTRIAAITALASVLGDAADAELETLLDHRDEQVGLTATTLLADQGNRACLGPLVSRLRSPDAETRTTCAGYLLAMTGEHFPRSIAGGGADSMPGAIAWQDWLQKNGATAPLRYPAGQVMHAGWVLNHHGRLQLAGTADGGWISQPQQLPWGEVRIAKVDLHKTAITDSDLANLKDLSDVTALDLSDCAKVTGLGLEHLWSWVHLQSLDLQGTAINDAGLQQLAFLSSLRLLNLTRCGKMTDAGLGCLRYLPRLAELHLEDTNITDAGVRSIVSMKNLRRLSFGRLVTDQTLQLLSSLPEITELSLSYSQVTGEGLRSVKGMRNLVKLRLYRCPRISDAGMAHLSSLDGLRHLVITCPRVTDIGLAYVGRLHHLEHLDLYTTQVTSDGLSHLAGLTKLQYLNLARTRVSDDGVKQLHPLTRLAYLNLSHTAISDTGLEALRHLTDLSHLCLESTPVTGEGLGHLASLSSLKELHLHNSRVRDVVFDWITGLPQLECLDLSSTRITDKCLPRLGGLTRLGRLDLSRTEVTNEGVEHLRFLTNLRELSLRRTNVASETREALRASLPNLQTAP